MNTPRRRLGPIAGRAVLAAVLLAAALLSNRLSLLNDGMAEAQENLIMRPAGTAIATYDGLADRIGVAERIPVAGPAIRADIARQRADAVYWQRDYTSLMSASPEDGDDMDPVTVFLSGNAAFRDLQRRNPKADEAAVQALDGVLERYTRVLQSDPGHVDAAYNYEFIVRLRNAAARGRPTNLRPQTDADAKGERGSPPPNTKPPEFNVIVPMRPDERRDQFEAGSGSVPVRKG